MKQRLLLASHRLPVTIEGRGEAWRVLESAGGLATGLRSPHERSNGIWCGYPGDLSPFSVRARGAIDAELQRRHLVPIALDAVELEAYYSRFSNAVLWPLFHYMVDRIPRDASDWQSYVSVNARFARVLASQFTPGDRVWIHDYQLALVPSMLRELVPEAKIGYFLHIPFPSSELFRLLPWRAEWLRGVLGADLIGFHTLAYQRHFSSALRRILGVEIDFNRIWVEGREVVLDSFPMGIDAEFFEDIAQRAASSVQTGVVESGVQVLLGVDRLDYTKGIPRRLMAYESLLEQQPSLCGRVRFVQVASPSREQVPEYERYKRELDSMVGRINGRFGTSDWTPIRYLTQAMTQTQLVALYRTADVMVVTPLRDGMNLVAKEYIASRVDEDGVLVLSEFAGASAELSAALLVNPYDISGMAQGLYAALTMAPVERQRRMRLMRNRVRDWTVHVWARQFLSALETTNSSELAAPPHDVATVLAAAGQMPRLILVLDYDGTLVSFNNQPLRSVPDEELQLKLTALSHCEGVVVHIVSGRTREALEELLGGHGIRLHAEHGLWSRDHRGNWKRRTVASDRIPAAVMRLLEETQERIPGCLLEQKSIGVVLHYRQADRETVDNHMLELQLHLQELLANDATQVISGAASFELRPSGINKGKIVRRIRAQNPGALILIVGDDRTDEDMFSAASDPVFTFHVGPGATRAHGRLSDPLAVRGLLEDLLVVRTTRRMRGRSDRQATQNG